MSERPLRILLSAFACEPGKGSERGNGWLWAEFLSRANDVTVLTDAGNRESIDAAVRRLGHRPTLRVEYVGPGRPTGSKTRLLAYVYRWQLAALHHARRLQGEMPFELVHHVTIGAHRFPSLLWRLDAPFVWGPIGGGETVSTRFYLPRWMGWRESMAEITRSMSNALVKVDPLQRATARGADAFGVTTIQTLEAFPPSTRAKAQLFPSTIVDRDTLLRLASHDPAPGSPSGLAVMFVGRLVGWKGPWLAIRAFHRYAQEHTDATFDLYGDGRMMSMLQQLVADLGMQDRIRLHGRIGRGELLDSYRRHQVFLFPSLHDSSGFVTIEAQAAALPVVCLDVGGPGQQVHPDAGVKVTARTPHQAIIDLARGLTTLTRDPERWRRASTAARRHALDPAATPTVEMIAHSLYEHAGVDLAGSTDASSE